MYRTLQLIFAMLLAITVSAQTQPDIVFKTNGEQLSGKVTAINDADIRFRYTGETLDYTIKKSDIQKIRFASGREEVFNQPAIVNGAAATENSGDAAPAGDPHNKVAILPFSFIKDGHPQPDEAGQEVQNEIYNMLSKHAGVYEILQPRRTIVMLNKAGVTKDTYMNFTMDEICKKLGVEYILTGSISVNSTTVTSTGTSSYNDKTKNEDDKKKNSGTSSSYSTAKQNYKTVVDMKIYNDKGTSIYNQNRQAFWNDQDSYKSTVEYLLKRCPLYRK
ncbi:hypothetical protein [Chitinophaga sp. Cy-1792]|uniref:hypothetical protein n=1 Tax=Chitinophaga sp. Cy-1792 TaxID=2608339 RepID=UPI001421D484|nr:hypothetical protein [Chitinophaga sp. Cy-1792]NIG56637.1 hypothetical protein [Chitinophaga sp. Cy-1792]